MTNAFIKAFNFKMKAAKNILISRGWVQSHSISFDPMHAACASGDFGVCFRKDGVSFYLNFLTIDQLPA